MGLGLELFSHQHIVLAQRFNARLQQSQGDAAYQLPEQVHARQSAAETTPFLTRQWVLVERTENGPAEARGGVLVQEMDCWVGHTRCRAANLQTPITEGSFQTGSAHLGPVLLKQVAARIPRLYAVGMGALDKPFPKLLKALRWDVSTCPFLFRVGRGSRFLKELAPLRKSGAVGWAVSAVAATQLAGPAACALQALSGWQQRGFRSISALRATPLEHWEEWATAIWEAAQPSISCGAIRDSQTLPFLYPLGAGRLRAFRLDDRTGQPVGWMVLLCTAMQGGHFGHLRVGTLVDALTLPGQEDAAVRAAAAALLEMDAELLLCNHTHPAWITALRHNGFFPGPSNYIFAASPALAKSRGQQTFVTRGDGDGRIHL
jgi:hypothetical protein